MRIMRPDAEEIESFMAEIELQPKHNYLCVMNKLNNVAKGAIFAGYSGPSQMLTGLVEKDHYMIITPEAIVVRQAKKDAAIQKFSKNEVHDFTVRDSKALPERKIISFTVGGNKQEYILTLGGGGRMAYNDINFDALTTQHWLGFSD